MTSSIPASESYRAVDLVNGVPTLVTRQSPERYRFNVAVRPILYGVCSADMKEAQGTRAVRRDFGHEFVAEVCDSDQSVLPIGSRVCLDPHVRVKRTSGFSQYVFISGEPDALPLALRTLPSTVSPRLGVFTEPLACAAHCVRKSADALERESLQEINLGVVGTGVFAVLIGLVAQQEGASVSLLGSSSQRLEWLRERQIFCPDQLIEGLRYNNGSAQLIVIATRYVNDLALQVAISAVRPGGVVMLFGGTSPGESYFADGQVCLDTIRRRESVQEVRCNTKSTILAGTYGAISSDFERSIDCLKVDAFADLIKRLIACELHLSDLPPFLRNWADGVHHNGKAIVNMTR